jgi:Family of unknown function (DUF6325)
MERRRLDSSSGSALEESGPPQPGLVELMVIAVPDIADSARVAEALRHLVEISNLRILDLVVVITDVAGAFTCKEFEEVSGLTLLRDVEGEVGGWLSIDDIALVSDALPALTTAVVLVAEDSWARPLADAVSGCGGRIIGGERLPTGPPDEQPRGRQP